MSDLLLVNLRRVEQVFGPDHLFALLLRWLLQFFSEVNLFFSGPTHVQAELLADRRRVRLTWKAPKNLDPAWDQVVVDWGIVGTLEEEKRELHVGATEIVLDSLAVGRKYQVCVKMSDQTGMARDLGGVRVLVEAVNFTELPSSMRCLVTRNCCFVSSAENLLCRFLDTAFCLSVKFYTIASIEVLVRGRNMVSDVTLISYNSTVLHVDFIDQGR